MGKMLLEASERCAEREEMRVSSYAKKKSKISLKIIQYTHIGGGSRSRSESRMGEREKRERGKGREKKREGE